MNKVLLILYMLVNGSFCFAALKSEGKSHWTLNADQSKIILSIDKDFHFNIQAPTFLSNNKSKQKPSLLTEKSIEFAWPKVLSKDASISYYVCDDAKTVCEPHTDFINSSNAKEFRPNKSQKKISNSVISIDDEGFIVNNFNFALKEAKKKNLPLLIDFTASWCPPCIRLKHETFNTEKFKKIASQFILVKVDVDLEENQALLDKYSIHAFPTIVITNKEGLEIGRILDFIPIDPLSVKLSEIMGANIVISEIHKKAKAGDKNSALKLAQNAYLALQYESCVEWFNRAEQKPIEFYMCQIALAEKSSSDEQINLYKKAIESFGDSYYSIDWRLSLVDLLSKDESKKEDFQKVLTETDKSIQKWIQNPELISSAHKNNELLELKDLILPELYFYLGSLNEIRNFKKESKENFELAIKKTLELQPNVKSPTIIIYLVRYLKKANQTGEALVWLQKLEKAYPTEYTYLQRQVTTLIDAKDFTKALPIAERSYDLSYGRNKISTGLQLATIKKELNQKENAKKLLLDLQTSSIVQQSNNKSYKEKIQKALKELE